MTHMVTHSIVDMDQTVPGARAVSAGAIPLPHGPHRRPCRGLHGGNGGAAQGKRCSTVLG